MSTPIKQDTEDPEQKYMGRCLELARQAAELDEVPVGAVVVLGGQIVAESHNRTREYGDPTAHAELLALQAAFEAVREARLPAADLFCSMEPCFMCTGALLHARVRRVVFAAADPKFGACGSLANLPEDPRLNHSCEVSSGVMAAESARLLREFFRRLR